MLNKKLELIEKIERGEKGYKNRQIFSVKTVLFNRKNGYSLQGKKTNYSTDKIKLKI